MDGSADYLLGNRSTFLSFVYLEAYFVDFYRILITVVNGIERSKEDLDSFSRVAFHHSKRPKSFMELCGKLSVVRDRRRQYKPILEKRLEDWGSVFNSENTWRRKLWRRCQGDRYKDRRDCLVRLWDLTVRLRSKRSAICSST